MVFISVKHKQNKAQAATELAVFGAVLIFLLGSIVRNGLNTGQQQNLQLKAMRQALLQSYQGSINKDASNHFEPLVGRNNSSIMYFEDRLSPDISRYGNSDRVQLMASGSGTLTNLLYYPLTTDAEIADARNLPTMDLYINGIHLPLTASALVTKVLNPPAGYAASYSGSPLAVLPGALNGKTHYKGWDFMCMNVLTRPDPGLPVDPITNPETQTLLGCPLFYNVSTKPGQYGILTEDEAFDLNRNDDFTDDAPAVAGNGKLARTDMSWHWKAEHASTDLNIDAANSSNNVFDVDNDGQEETIYKFTTDANNIITTVTVMDGQEGDFDGSMEFINGRIPGLQQEMSILTQGRSGTYFTIKEGKLYNPESGKYARSVNFKDQVELVQRMFQLTKNTGRFCSQDLVPVRAATLPDGTANPVEACGTGGLSGGSSCFTGDNVKQTCLDTETLMLYLRTRVLDKTGHAWLSSTQGAMP